MRNRALEKPICICKTEMVFLMGSKKEILWECPKCLKLMLQGKYAGVRMFYTPGEG